MIAVVSNAQEAALLLEQQIKQFDVEQRKNVKKAADLFKVAIQAELRSGSPLKVGTGQTAARKQKGIGPLNRRIKAFVRVNRSAHTVWAKIGPTKRGFYGWILERGVDTTVFIAQSGNRFRAREGRGIGSLVKLASRFGGHKGAKEKIVRSYHLRIRPHRFLAPVAAAKRDAAILIVGDSFKVFQYGRAI